jgi:uncharacterized protein (DUF1501 family)
MCGATATTLSIPALMRALSSEASAASNTILVLYEMNGGNDAFNMIIPLDSANFATYNQLRGDNIAIAETAIETAQTYFDATPSPVGQGSTFGFNPIMGAATAGATNNLRWLYGQGKVGIIMGSGLPFSAYSRNGHQQAQFYWATSGINNLGDTNVGWIGQAFDQIGGGGAVPPMIAIDGSNEIALNGQKSSALIINGNYSSLANFSPNYPSGSSAFPNALTGNDNYVTQPIASEFARALGVETTSYVSAVKSYAANATVAPLIKKYPTKYPTGSNNTSYVKTQFQQVANMILAGAPSRCYYVRQGGYDSHSGQLAGQTPLLGEFSEGVTEFYQFLKANNASSNVVIATVSDFGREAFSNSTNGTDHGTATMHYFIGDMVKGGVYADFNAPLAPSNQMPQGVSSNGVSKTGYPDFTNRDNNSYTVVSIDFRSQLSALIQFLGANPENIVGTQFAAIAGTGLQGILGSAAV